MAVCFHFGSFSRRNRASAPGAIVTSEAAGYCLVSVHHEPLDTHDCGSFEAIIDLRLEDLALARLFDAGGKTAREMSH
jgi:hypothetical protein